MGPEDDGRYWANCTRLGVRMPTDVRTSSVPKCRRCVLEEDFSVEGPAMVSVPVRVATETLVELNKYGVLGPGRGVAGSQSS